ncbi:sugar phosphate nucleotidyltransferase [Allonocardiopsis opalescens]|uniref:Mannose-1-phosphate guanylyltransferase n=1 Tax=Allonocardiopsis opalescens TaxID=1144618 RepID=A0A2T0PSG3_9ACTN|nr:sugar phosphate nucleotidyltransferase [Allonocardiopsis opalescens]PRX91837.1 mannose-1-phosphate guanylyltransferase [Allonocardiopsis opalescens]
MSLTPTHANDPHVVIDATEVCGRPGRQNPFRAMGGEPGVSDALRRARQVTSADRIHLVATAADSVRVAAAADAFEVAGLLLVPRPPGSAAAFALGTAAAAADDSAATVLCLPADQLVAADGHWQLTVRRMVKATRVAAVVCAGVAPQEPQTGYCYVYAPPGRGSAGLRTAHSLDEHPDRTSARRYLRARNYFWHTRLLAWQAADFAELLRRHAPRLAAAVDAHPDEHPAAWPLDRDLPRTPVERAVMAPASAEGRLVLVPAVLRWNDLGAGAPPRPFGGTRPDDRLPA